MGECEVLPDPTSQNTIAGLSVGDCFPSPSLQCRKGTQSPFMESWTLNEHRWGSAGGPEERPSFLGVGAGS